MPKSPPTSVPPPADDPDAWVARHADELHRYARRRVATEHESEDLVQETLLAGWKRMRTLAAGEAPPDARWLNGVLKNKIADHYRRVFRERGAGDPGAELVSGEYEPNGHWEDARAPRDWVEPSVGDGRAASELREALARCLGFLPVAHSRVFLLREVEDLDIADIQKLTGHTATNLFVMLHRARAALRRCLEDNHFNAAGPSR